MEKVGKEERVTQEMGRGQWRGPSRRAPGAEAGKKEETKNKRRKTKGQWESIPLTPTSLNFGVAVVTASKGQGRGERVGLGPEGQPGLRPLFWGALPGRGTKAGAGGASSAPSLGILRTH